MNLLRTYAAALLVILTIGVSACRRDELSPPFPTPSEEANGGNKISFNVDIEGLPAEDLRMILQEEMDGNKHAGLKFVWHPGDTEVLWLAFKTESRTPGTVGGALYVRQSTLTILGREGTRYKARVDVNAPAGLDPEQDEVFVAGAIGVKEIDGFTGRAVVPGPSYFYDKGKSYVPPMYFAPTRLHSKVEGGVRGYYADNLTFRFYGAMVGATIDNTQGNMLYSPHEITMQTDALTTEGEMSLFDLETNSDGLSVPKWTTKQTVDSLKRVYFEQGDVAVGEKRTYYFWAVPSKFDDRREMTMEFRTDAYDSVLEETEAEITTKWKVKQLAAGKVHRLSLDLPAPQGELIITEVFLGGGLSATAWEFYNPTDAPVDLRKYSLQRYDRTSTGDYPSTPNATTKLYQPTAFRETHVDNSGRLGVNPYMLPAHKSIVYVASGVMLFINKDKLAARPGLAYMYGFASHIAVIGDKEWPKAFYSNKSTRYLLVKDKDGTLEPVDAFFWYEDDYPAHYPTATLMRKPGRDLPRRYMQLKSNSDWIMRERKEGLDWGYRFGYYYDRERLGGFAHGAHWLDDVSTGPNVSPDINDNGFLNQRPLFAPDFRTGDLSFDDLKKQSKTRKYTPPMWWTKERAQAADR
jgi:lipoprotein